MQTWSSPRCQAMAAFLSGPAARGIAARSCFLATKQSERQATKLAALAAKPVSFSCAMHAVSREPRSAEAYFLAEMFGVKSLAFGDAACCLLVADWLLSSEGLLLLFFLMS